MSKHIVHRYASKLMFGKAFPEVDRAIDMPAKFMGKGHRKLFHTFPESFFVGSLASQDPKGGVAGCFHVQLDKMCSRDKKLEKWLEFCAKEDVLWRRQMRMWKKLMRRR